VTGQSLDSLTNMEPAQDFFTALNHYAGRQVETSTEMAANSTSGRDEDGLFYVPPGLVAFLSVIYGSVSVIAVVGNLLVIIVVLTSARMHTVTNYFIANLSISDVMIGCLSIPFQFQAAILQRWDLPEIHRLPLSASHPRYFYRSHVENLAEPPPDQTSTSKFIHLEDFC